MASKRSSSSSSNLITIMVITLVVMVMVIPPVVFGRTSNSIGGGESLNAGQSLNWGNFRFIMQGDCNLVLYDENRAGWSSGTYGQGTACRATLERNGQIVIYNDRGVGIWSSNKAQPWGKYTLILQSDRNVVIYGPNGAVWATNTVKPFETSNKVGN